MDNMTNNTIEDSLDRIDEVLEYYGSNRTQLARKMGMAQSTLSEIFSRGTDPKRKLMKKVCEVYQDVRIQWLENGELPMLKSQDKSLNIEMLSSSIDRLRDIICKQQETIDRLCALIEKKN